MPQVFRMRGKAVALSRTNPRWAKSLSHLHAAAADYTPSRTQALHCAKKVRLRIRHGTFLVLQKGEALRRYSPTLQPITVHRIERALDRVAEIIVGRDDQGEIWLPLYDYLERALQDYRAKEERLAAVRQRVIRSQDRTATRSS